MKIKLNTFYACLIACILALLWSDRSLADIGNFPWSTTFDCDEYNQAIDGVNGVNCDGIEKLRVDAYANGQGTLITADANYSGGGGGRGYRWFVSDTVVGNVVANSGPMDLRFSDLSEVWVRVYYRVPSGQNLTKLNYWKLFYFFYNDSNNTYVDTYSDGEGVRLISDGGSLQANGTTGPYDCYGGVSDGSWHAMEVHVNTSTNTFEFWNYCDGVDDSIPELSVSSAKYSSNMYDEVAIPANSHPPGFDGYIDFDDFAISTSGRIGPLNGPGETTDTAPDIFTEGFDDDNFSSRDWFDDTSKIVDTSHKYSGTGSLKYTWTQSGIVPNNGLALRKEFDPTDELYVSFRIYFEDIYRGSQVNYHPHFIYILSDLDNPWGGLARNYLNTYVEFVSDIGSPYELRPQIQLQDSLRVNTNLGATPNDLTEVTEDRSAMYCNGCKSGAECGTGDCFGSPRYSANYWKDTSIEIPKGQWVHYEAYFKMNTISGGVGQADGLMKLWIDGKLSLNYSNIVYRTNQDATKKWATIVLAPYIGDGSPIAQSFWVDDLKLATSYSGSGAGDTVSLPAPPTGLKIINN